jgi:gluconokinase
MTGPLALAVDVGTSAVRAFVYDSAGFGISGVRLRYEWNTTRDGGAEIAAERIVALVVEAIEGAVSQAGVLGNRIAAVGLTGMWHTLVAVGADDVALTPLYAWTDTRSSRAAAGMRTELDEPTFHARTGTVFHPSYMPARIRWLREVMPSVATRVARWMTVGDYIALRLFGTPAISVSLASGSGLFDQHMLRWDGPLLAALEIGPEQLPTVIDRDESSRGLRPEFATRLGRLRETPFFATLGDGACANVGSGCMTAGELALSIGSSAALRVVARADDFRIPAGLWCYRLDRAHVVMGGALSNGGNVYAWLRDMLRLPSQDEVEIALASRGPDTHALTVLPFLAGERSPDWSLTARAAVAGLGLDTGPLDLLRASMEGVALRLALIQRLLHGYFPGLRTIVGSGGALRQSPAWAQMVTDTLGSPLAITEDHETSSRGVALLSLEAIGAIPDAAAVSPPATRVLVPVAERTKVYAAALARQLALAKAISAWEREIADHP